MSVNKQGFERTYGGNKKKTNYVPVETGKSKSRDYKKRAEAKEREKSKRSGAEQLDRLDSMGYNAKRERARIAQELKDQ